MSHTPHSLILTPTDRTTTSPSRHILPPLSHLPRQTRHDNLSVTECSVADLSHTLPDQKVSVKKTPRPNNLFAFSVSLSKPRRLHGAIDGPVPGNRRPASDSAGDRLQRDSAGDRPQRDFHQRPTAARFTPPTACSEVFPRPLAGPKAPNSSRSRYRLKNNQHG